MFLSLTVTSSMEAAMKQFASGVDQVQFFNDDMDNHAAYIIEGNNLFSLFYVRRPPRREYLYIINLFSFDTQL